MLRTLFPLALLAMSAPSIGDDFAWQKLVELTDPSSAIGARPGGSAKERQTAAWLTQEWQALGHKVKEMPFDFELRGLPLSSSNLSITIKGKSKKTILIGAHYDSTGEKHGSLGTIDNCSGVAALLGLANRLSEQTPAHTVRLVAFGAEEIGLQGSRAYVNDRQEPLGPVIAMINLDTIIGGDKLYVHSALESGYECNDTKGGKFTSSVKVRDALLEIAQGQYGDDAHGLHPAYSDYPEGQTGDWSDHAPFACSGIPIAYLEATNFDINGHSGYDGYSQTSHAKLWDCYDSNTSGACDREKESKWGMIWHTQFDRLDQLQPLFQQRLQTQLKQNVELLEAYLMQASF